MPFFIFTLPKVAVSRATLLVIQGIEQGVRFEIEEDDVGLGRGVQNFVRVHDTEVSRSHARLQCTGGRYVLIDENSANGTYVNGQAVRQKELTNGDRVQIGRTVMLFTQAEEDSSTQGVAERVNLLGQHDPEDRSSIVEAASAPAGEPLAALATETPESLSDSVINLQVLYRIAEEAVRPSLTIEQLLTRILNLALETAGADRGCVLVRDAGGELIPLAFAHRPGVDATTRMPVSRSIVDYVLQNRQGVRTTDARTDTRFAPGQSILQAGIREAICVPMQGRYDLVGVIYIDITTSPERVILQGRPVNRFSDELLRLMIAVGRQSALAVEDNRYQQALVKAERLAAVGQTITILSHHIKNILQGIRGGSYLIDMGLKDHSEDLVRKGWHIVEKNQGRIYHLVMDMLTYSKERLPALKRAQLNETVGEVCELLTARAAELNIQLEWQPADLPLTTFDPEGIHRAVLNIATNALDAVEGMTDRPGRVLLQTGYDAEKNAVFVAVTDNGPGIPAAILPTIFNIFESTKGARGTGIGLAVSQKIIREHGGDITVESTPGDGARFTLQWPVIEEDAEAIEGATIS